MATTTNDYPTTDSVTDSALAFMRAHLIRNGVPATSASSATAKGSSNWMTVRAFAQSVTILLANARALEDATMADTATGDDLDRLAAIWGLSRSTGAGAQGSVTVTCTGTVAFAAGSELVAPTGKRYRVVSPASKTNGQSIEIIGIDTGKSTNLAAGVVMTWTSPPAGCATTALVAAGGLTNGQDADTDAGLRKRLLKLLQQPQNGGSWSHYRQWTEDASAAVEGAFVYPAAQGPGTVHVAYTIEGTAANSYARAGDAALTTLVEASVLAEQPEFADLTLTTVAHEALSCALKVVLPEPPVSGGPGGGWIDESADRWAIALTGGGGGTAGVVTISSVTSATAFTVNANTEPVDGSSISFFSSTSLEVLDCEVVSHSGVAGAWGIVVDTAFPDLIAGDYLFPQCEHGAEYAAAFQAAIALLSPGEKTADAEVLPRAYRHPRAIDGYPSAVTTTQLTALQSAFPAISNAAYFYLGGLSFTLPVEPTVASAVTDSPNVWRVSKFALYPAA
jgi:phage-related baseplate assembly protein